MNIPQGVAIALIAYGALSIWKPGLSLAKGKLGVILSIAAIVVGLSGAGYLGSVNLDKLTNQQTVVPGDVTVELHTGLANTTTTVDYLNAAEDVMTFYVTDASMLDGEEIKFNATISRSEVATAGLVVVTCTIPDQEISGVTADNLAEKTLGKIDLDINDGGSHVDDNTVKYSEAFAEGDNEENVQIAFDVEETYHDGLVDMSDQVVVSCDANGTPFSAVIIANS